MYQPTGVGSIGITVKSLLASRLRPFFFVAAGASLPLNLALLVPSIYVLQVFDRVLATRSNETLIVLSVLALLALLLGYFCDNVRTNALAWTGRALDRLLSPIALEDSLQRASSDAGRPDTEIMRDIARVRAFLSSTGALALFDAAWLPVYLVIIGLMHPLLGLTAFLGSAFLLTLAVITEKFTRANTDVAMQSDRVTADYERGLTRGAEVIVGMGMSGAAITGWQSRHDVTLEAQERLVRISSRMSALARTSRQGLQVGMLALGAGLVVDARASAGIMVAATLLLGRALQPVEQLIAGWKSLVDVRAAWARLKERKIPAPQSSVALPAPVGKIDVERVWYAATSFRPALIKGVSLHVEAGESLGIIGRSASGKTTLIRLLLGILKPYSGVVRLDEADISHWQRDSLGVHVGYLPQDVGLFSGTVAQNIARLGSVDSMRVVEAAKAAHAHEMILRMPDGYDTRVGEAAAMLSGGQRQRIALARALYGNPRIVVLDEPNANLDAEGEAALGRTLANLRRGRVTVVIAGHQINLMTQLDKLLLLNNGAVEAFGSTDAVLGRNSAMVVPIHSRSGQHS
jgi:PrtD family type I secretion system ABC transporter